jgi:1-acyl-sn-glycerol-3-phosphate acyltransferase
VATRKDVDIARVEARARTRLGRAVAALPARWFHATLEGGERIPRAGAALLVGNHAFMGLDGVVLGTLVLRETDRVVRFLGERNLWRVPGLAQLLTSVGAIPGVPDDAVDLLRAGHLVAVYPGGVDDSFKLATEKYRLRWGSRAGFARVAMRAGVPILPVAALGIDDMFTVVGRERWLGRRLFRGARYDLPLAYGALGMPVPRRVPQRYVVLPPVDTGGDPANDGDVERVRAATHDAIDAVLATARQTLASGTSAQGS